MDTARFDVVSVTAVEGDDVSGVEAGLHDDVHNAVRCQVRRLWTNESCSLYYKHTTIVNDDSSVVSEQSF